MARETKIQRLAREDQERVAYEAELKATYPQRLMDMLERAQKVNFELTVKDGEFQLVDRDASRYSVMERDIVSLTLTYDSQNEQAIQELDWRVERKEEAEREAQRRVLARNKALNKLTLEERELLGL
jgi:uncharacterized membrane protein